MSLLDFLIIWSIISTSLLAGALVNLIGSKKYIETFDWEKEKHNFFPYNWPDSPRERKERETFQNMERMQRQLWYKEFFKD
jgi:hypothetical protein